MLTPEQIEAIRLQLFRLTDPVNTFLLSDIARRVKEAGQLTSAAQYQVWVSQMLGVSQERTKRELGRLLKKSRKEIDKLMTQAAEVGYDFDLSRLPSADAIPFEQNGTVQQILRAAIDMADADFHNLTQTMGMVGPYGRPMPLRDVYLSCTDYAFKLTSTGATDYMTAIRKATRKLADYGVLSVNYESGVKTSLEAAVRRNIMGGLGLMQEQISQHNHDTLGADGWEISAHANSAPDHEPYQGKQYTDAEYQALQDSLHRHIGTLNCGHVASPIIVGVSAPQYTKKELKDFQSSNKSGIMYEGRHFTGYEATQQQRALERAIRQEKRRLLVDRAGGDLRSLPQDRSRLNIITQRYKHFCKAAGLRPETERMHVPGWVA